MLRIDQTLKARSDGDRMTQHAEHCFRLSAQVFIALATHLDAYEPQTVGSLERLSKPGVGAPLIKALRRVVTALKGAPSRRR